MGIIQRIASIFYIICVLLCLIKYNFVIEMFIFTRIMIKLGAAPFHRWFLSLSKTLSLFILMLISTVQKIIPIIILRLLNVINNIIIFVCVITFFVIFYNSLLLLSLIKILALSRINNQLSSSNHYRKLIKIFVLLSLGGLPPFLGFLGKLYIIKISITVINRIFLFLLVIRSLFVLFIYIRFSFIILSFPSLTRLRTVETKNKLHKNLYLISICV